MNAQGVHTEVRVHCTVCLSVDRNLSPIGNHAEILSIIMANTELSISMDNIGSIQICWECRANLRKASGLRKRACHAQQLLQLSRLYSTVNLPTTLTALKVTYKENYDYMFTHIDVEIANDDRYSECESPVDSYDDSMDVNSEEAPPECSYSEDSSRKCNNSEEAPPECSYSEDSSRKCINSEEATRKYIKSENIQGSSAEPGEDIELEEMGNDEAQDTFNEQTKSTRTVQDLIDLLNETIDGQTVLFYGKNNNGLLDVMSRRKLSNIIIKKELYINPSIPGKILQQWAYRIKSLFPKEVPTTYYKPWNYSMNSRARGKLQDAYCNRKKDLRKTGLIPTRKHMPRDTVHNYLPQILRNDNITCHSEHYSFLLNNSSPWDTVEMYWKETALYRLKEAYMIYKGNRDYMNKYPALGSQKGYQLLLHDHDFICPNVQIDIRSALSIYATNIIELMKNKLNCMQVEDDIEDVQALLSPGIDDPETSGVCALMLLPYLIPPTYCRWKRVWKPPKLEIRETFIKKCANIADVKKFMTIRTSKLAELDVPFHPLVLYIGDVFKPNHVFSVVGSSCYRLSDIFTAVEVTYKMFHAIGADYPRECAGVWQFIQQAFFSVFLRRDKQCHSVSAIMSDLGIGAAD